MLAIVEDQQSRLVSKIRNEAWCRIIRLNGETENRGERCRRKARVAQRAEIHEQNVAGESVGQVVGNRNGDRRLAHPARAGDGDESLRGQVRRKVDDPVGTTHHAKQAVR